MSVKKPDFAGSWYPADRRDCLRQIKEFDQNCTAVVGPAPLFGGLVPHAGWAFSGRLAHQALRELQRGAGQVHTVVLFGGHQGPRSRSGALVEGEVWTPLGNLAVDEELAEAVAGACGLDRHRALEHPRDNTLELQYPLLAHHFPKVRLLSLTPAANPEALTLAAAVAEAAARLGRRIVSVGSTDLTHYGANYGWAPRGRGRPALDWVRNEVDPLVITRALELDGAGLLQVALEHRNACCPGAAAAAVELGRLQGSHGGTLLAYATSNDVAPSDSFVGYAAIVF